MKKWMSHKVKRKEKQNKSGLVSGLFFAINLLGNMEITGVHHQKNNIHVQCKTKTKYIPHCRNKRTLKSTHTKTIKHKYITIQLLCYNKMKDKKYDTVGNSFKF